MKILSVKIFKIIVSMLVAVTANAQQSPNIIIIYVDDMGYGDLSSYGGEIPTPNIDGIAKQGIRFTGFYAQPVCTPSRYSLLTGKTPQRSRHGLTFALMPDDKNYLDTTEHTIAWYLKQKKYCTGMVGKWHLGSADHNTRPTQYGFDYFSGTMGGCIDYFNHNYGSMGNDWFVNNKPVKEEGYSTDLLTNHAKEFIHANKNGQPFFLYLAYNAPHYGKTDTTQIQPYTLKLSDAKYKGFNDINSLQAPETYLKRFAYISDPYRRAYAAMVASLDDNVGRLLNWLEEMTLLGNTMIWFISDNGGYSKSYNAHASNGALRGQKGQLWEGGIRVPGMVMWKNKIKPGLVSHSPVCNMDLLPTLAAIIGNTQMLSSSTIDGIDISPVIFEQREPERELYWKFNNQTAFRHGKWKLVNGKELYNLETDAGENQNVADKFQGIVTDLLKAQQKKEETINNEK
jgi:arylsulfatase A